MTVLSTPDHWALSARGRHARPFPRRGGRGPGRPLRCVRGRQGGRTGLCADQAAAGSEGVPARLQDEGAWPSAQERLRLGPPAVAVAHAHLVPTPHQLRHLSVPSRHRSPNGARRVPVCHVSDASSAAHAPAPCLRPAKPSHVLTLFYIV